MKINFWFIAAVLFFHPTIWAANFINSTSFFTIRVRLVKEITAFPHISTGKTKKIFSHVWSLEGQKLFFQKKQLAEKNFIIENSNGKFEIIGLFDLNSYLTGVISKEMPLSWPVEALKAQAVVARSFALARIGERKNKTFHLDADQMDQVFEVSSSEKAKLAVFQTDDIILKDKNNKVLKAYYHADCGGQTVPASKVWPNAIDSGTATDPWCAGRKSNAWSFSIAANEFNSRLGLSQNDGEAAIVAESFKSKIQTLEISQQVFSVQKLRQIFGFSTIRNSPSAINAIDGEIQIVGKGFGHGAGLCQWGSLAQAKLGLGFAQILQHYYPDAVLSMNAMKLTKNIASDLVFN